MSIGEKALPILNVLWNEQEYWRKNYCYPSQMRIVQELREKCSVRKSRRTLNRWLRKLEDRQIIRRTRRLKHHPIKGLMFKSTLYHITFLGFNLLYRAGFMSGKRYRSKLAAFREQERIRKEKPESDMPSGFGTVYPPPEVNLKTF